MKTYIKLAALMTLAAALGGCLGDDDEVAAPPPPAAAPPVVVVPVVPPVPTVQLAATSTVAGLTVFYQAQTMVDTGGGWAVPAASPNSWDLNRDFSLEDGGRDQFDTALAISVTSGNGIVTTTASFPSNQNYSELKYLTPEYGAADGTAGAIISNSTLTYSPFTNTTTVAWLSPSQDSRLQQTVVLPAGPGPLTLSWDTLSKSIGGSSSGYLTGETSFFKVVLRSSAGVLLGTLYEGQNGAVVTGTLGTANVTAFAGQTVVLSFEARSTYNPDNNNYGPGVDNVSLLNGATELIVNGSFEAGATGWMVNKPQSSQNVASGTRTVADFVVQRSVYVPPTEKWGRWVDTYTNPSSTTITGTVTYSTDLGSDRGGIIYQTPGTAGKALTSWDGRASNSDRDVGMVFGSVGVGQTFTSATTLDVTNGVDDFFWVYPVTVPPGGTVSIVQFIILTTDVVMQTPGATLASRATQTDAIALEIVTNFRTNVKYRHGMTQKQIDTILNF